MTRPANTILASAARAARKRGMTAEQALRIVAREYGAVFNREGRVDGYVLPEDERAVRKLPTTKPTDPSGTQEDPNGPKHG